MQKIIHQIWVGPYSLPDIEKEYTLRIKENNSDFEYMFWTDKNVPTLPENLQKVYDILGKNEDYAFQADLLRLFVVYKYGGLYLDVDYKYIGSFTNSPFFDYSGVFFYHPTVHPTWGGDFTIPNGIFGAEKESEILKYLMNTITEQKHWMGPSWLGVEIRNFLNLKENESHNVVEQELLNRNFLYYSYNELQKTYVIHNALASWVPEHKKEFKSGNINFQKGKK